VPRQATFARVERCRPKDPSRAEQRIGACHWLSEKLLTEGGLADHNAGMPELDPATVVEAVARDPRLRAFTGHGRIETLPARQARRHLLLDKIAQAFEPGVRYSERRVSLFLGALHADYAALRRYLVDEEFLSRSDGQYWRSGGTVLPSPPDEPSCHRPAHGTLMA
jgi:hypothetical protein